MKGTHLILVLQPLNFEKKGHELCQPLLVDLFCLELGKVVVVGHKVGDDGLFVAAAHHV